MSEIYPLEEWKKAISVFPDVNTQEAFDVYNDLVMSYTNDNRKYHNLDHVCTMIKYINEMLEIYKIENQDKTKALMVIATFFHDSVYDVTVIKENMIYSNEELSADYAINSLKRMNINIIDDIQFVSDLIKITETHKIDESINIDSLIQSIFIDSDMAIFAEDIDTYTKYANGIREEYSHISDEVYSNGRKQFLTSVINKAIFHTGYMRKIYYDVAVNNISIEMASL